MNVTGSNVNIENQIIPETVIGAAAILSAASPRAQSKIKRNEVYLNSGSYEETAMTYAQ